MDTVRDQINDACRRDWLNNMRLSDETLFATSQCFQTHCDECSGFCNKVAKGSDVLKDLLAAKSIIKQLCTITKPLLASVNGECYLGEDKERDMVYDIRHFMQSIGEYDAIIRDDE